MKKFVLFLFLCAAGAAHARTSEVLLSRSQQESCTPDTAKNAGLFVSPPTDIFSVGSGGVTALGHLNPVGGHIFPTDHMYIAFPADSYDHPVYAMASGDIYMIMYQGDNDWQVSINHTCSVSTYVTHLYSLSTRIQNYLMGWYGVSAVNQLPFQAGMILFLGQDGDAPMLHVNAGEAIGAIRAGGSHSTWDVGVIDARYVNGSFADTSALRYPEIPDLLSLYGAHWNPYRKVLLSERQHTHAGCFLDYFPGSGAKLMHDGSTLASWQAVLTGGSCGSVGWDTWDHSSNTARLQGSWFNTAYLSLNKIVPDYQNAVFTAVPNESDSTKFNIAFAFSNSMRDSRYNSFLLDASATPHFFNPITPGTSPADQNIAPSLVSKASGTICYDLSYGNYDYVLVNMTDDFTLRVKYFAAGAGSAVCGTLSRPLASPDSTWKTFQR